MATLAIGGLSVAALTGCAHAHLPSSGASRHPAAHPTSSPSASPSSLTTPGDATCDTLAPLSTVRAALTSTAVTPQPYYVIEGGGPPELYDMVVPLAGGLQCLWQDSPADPNFALAVTVLPNASAALTAATPDLLLGDDAHDEIAQPGVPVYGDVSWTHCINVDDPSYGQCNFDMKVGSYWVSIDETNRDLEHPYPQAAAEVALLNGIVSAVRRFPPTPTTWHPAAESFTLPATCAQVLPLATLRAGVGAPALTAIADSDPGADLYSLNGAAGRATHQLECFWETADHSSSLAFDLLPGSASVWNLAGGPAAAEASGMTAVASLGSSAYQKCVTNSYGSNCQAAVLVGHTWLELSEVKASAVSPTGFDSLARQIVGAMG